MTRAEIIDRILELVNEASDLAHDPRLDTLYRVSELRSSLENAGEMAGKNEGCDDDAGDAGDDDDDDDQDGDAGDGDAGDDDDQDGDAGDASTSPRLCNGGPDGPWCGAAAVFVSRDDQGLEWFCCDAHVAPGTAVTITSWRKAHGLQ